MRRSALVLFFVMLGWVSVLQAAAPKRHRAAASHSTASAHKSHEVAARRGSASHRPATRREQVSARRQQVTTRHGRIVHVRGRAVRHYSERFTASSFNDNLTEGDITTGEDPVVRAAAIEALGNMNGTALAIDPSSGRILAMVNQKLALSSGAEPCSTIKVAVALAALQEGLVKSDTPVNLGGHYSLDLTHALAKSVNLYFEVLGRAMGFERVKHYANEFGLGELAGYNDSGGTSGYLS